MDEWVIKEIEALEAKIDEMDSPGNLSREIRSIRAEAERIAHFGFQNGPMSPFILGFDPLKQRINKLKAWVNL